MKVQELPGFEVQLLGRAAYSSHDPTRLHSLGIALERQQGVHYAASLLLNLPIPTIAAVNGAAVGAGDDHARA